MSAFEAIERLAIQRAPALIREQVATYLRDAITSHQLQPGSMLIEREICEVTTASRATVREALRQLESQGLVISEAGRGSFVAVLTQDEAREIYEVRSELEGLACRLFAQKASGEQITALVKTVEEMAATVTSPSMMLQKKAVFYDALFAGAGNRELQRMLVGVRQRITLVRANSLSIPGRPQQSLAEIQAVVEAIVERDAMRAEQLCIEHIEAAARASLGAADSEFGSTAIRQRRSISGTGL